MCEEAKVRWKQASATERDLIESFGSLVFTRPDGAILLDLDDLVQEHIDVLKASGIELPEAQYVIFFP